MKGEIHGEETVGRFYFDKRLVVPFDHACMCNWCGCAMEISFISEGKEFSCATLMNVSACVCMCVLPFDWHRFLSGCMCSDLNSLALDPPHKLKL